MKRAFVCLLALCAMLLAACGQPAVTLPAEGGEPVVSPPPEPVELAGETAEYTSGNVDLALTIPEGWSWETMEADGQAGIRFWKTDDTDTAFRLTCWRSGYGICGTGVTTEELTLSGGQKVWQYAEETYGRVWVDIAFVGTPGDYVCMPDANGTMDKAAWDGCREEVLTILSTARIGRGILTEEEAVELAEAQYDGEYDMAWGRYDVEGGVWTVTFTKGAMGQTNDVLLVANDGTVSVRDGGAN